MPPPAEGLASRLFLGPALRTQPDRRLVTLVREGYEIAFEEIVRRYGKALRRYATAIVGGRGEDVTQDALAKALLALRRDDAEIELRPWLYRIVRNTALNELRDRPPEAAALAEAIASGHSLTEEVEQRAELASLIERLRALPEPQRAAIVMRELEGLSHEEIAAALGLSGGGARQTIYRARRALRDGAALLLPLPLLRLLIDHAGEAAAAGMGAGAGGAVATAAGASAGGAGAGGVALKAGVVAAVLAGSVGTGVALRDEGGGRTAGAAVPVAGNATGPAPRPPALAPEAVAAVDDSSPGEDRSGDDGGRRQQGSDGETGGGRGDGLESSRQGGERRGRERRRDLPGRQRPNGRPGHKDRVGGAHGGQRPRGDRPPPTRDGPRVRPPGDRQAGYPGGGDLSRDGRDSPPSGSAEPPPPPPPEETDRQVSGGDELEEEGRERRRDDLP